MHCTVQKPLPKPKIINAFLTNDIHNLKRKKKTDFYQVAKNCACSWHAWHVIGVPPTWWDNNV